MSAGTPPPAPPTASTVWPGNFSTTTSAPYDRSQYHGGILECGDPDTEAACARACVSTLLGVLTLVACCYKCWRFTQSALANRSHTIVLALAAAEAGIFVLKWAVLSKAKFMWLHFLGIYIHVLQFLVVCIFYCGLVLKLTRNRRLIFRVCYPCAAVVTAYMTGVLVWAIASHDADQVECRQPHWLLFSSSQIALSLAFVAIGVYLTRHMASIQNVGESLRFWKRVTLWSLIGAYCFEAAVAFAFDVTFVVAVDDDCDTVFGDHNSAGYNTYEMVSRVSVLIPVWTVLGVFKAGTQRQHRMNVQQSRMRITYSDRDESEASLMLVADATE